MDHGYDRPTEEVDRGKRLCHCAAGTSTAHELVEWSVVYVLVLARDREIGCTSGVLLPCLARNTYTAGCNSDGGSIKGNDFGIIPQPPSTYSVRCSLGGGLDKSAFGVRSLQVPRGPER